MFKVLDLAKYVINKCIEIEKPINNLKLQKVIYYIQGNFLSQLGYPAFKEDILAWRHGPVAPDVYYEYNFYVASLINAKQPVEICLNNEEKELILKIIKEKNKYSAWELVEQVWQEDPWKNNYEPNANNVIPRDCIKKFFKKES